MSLLRSPLIPVGSSSYQTTQATVSSLPVKAMSGSTPERVGSMLSDGRWLPPERSCPEGSQRFAPALKRLAKMFVGGPKAAFGSYQATHGTVRPAPAKSIDGASASAVGSMLSDAGKPWVTQAPF